MINERKNIIVRVLAIALYLLGACIVLALLGIWLLRVGYVPFPDAMLPMALYELAIQWLAAGAVPMAAAAWAVYCVCGFSKHAHPRRDTLLLMLPAAICGLCLAAEAAMFAVMLVKGCFIASGG